MSKNLSSFLRTESKVRKANEDGIWEILEESAVEIERLQSENSQLRQLAGAVSLDVKSFAEIRDEAKRGTDAKDAG